MPNALTKVKSFMATDSIQNRLKEMLDEECGVFTNSVINLVSSSAALQNCTAESIGASAIKAATVRLPIDPAFGFAAIIPYGKIATFQMMYRGWIQLGIRTGQYERINATQIYKDELISHNPITEEIIFADPKTYALRANANPKDVCGFYAMFRLLPGFQKEVYMTFDEVMAHAKKYSKPYQKDLKNKTKKCQWSTDPVSMGPKTPLLKALTKYGVMSIEMRETLKDQRESFDDARNRTGENIKASAGRKKVKSEDVTGEPEPDPEENDREPGQDDDADGEEWNTA